MGKSICYCFIFDYKFSRIFILLSYFSTCVHGLMKKIISCQFEELSWSSLKYFIMPKLLIKYSKIILRNEMTSISLFRLQQLPSRLIKTLHCSECHAFKPKPNETCNDDHHYKGYIYLANHSIW